MPIAIRPAAALLATAVLTACAVNASGNGATRAFTVDDSLSVAASTDKWIRGSLNRDYDLFAESVTPDVILYPANAAPIRGREAAVEFLRSYPPMTAFVVNVAELSGRGDLAFDHGTYTATVQLPNGVVANDTGSFAVIFKRQADGTWAHHRVIFHSNLPPAPAPAASSAAPRR